MLHSFKEMSNESAGLLRQGPTIAAAEVRQHIRRSTVCIVYSVFLLFAYNVVLAKTKPQFCYLLLSRQHLLECMSGG